MNKKEGVSLIKNAIKKINKNPTFIGISGGSCSGKGYLSSKLPGKILHLDDYYVEKPAKNNNYDNPSRIRFDLLIKHIKLLKNNKNIDKPVYDFVTHTVKNYEKFNSSKIIIVEGIHALNKRLNKFYDIKVFVDSDDKLKLERRLKRDFKERGRTKVSIIRQWNSTVVPMYKKFILPTKEYADVVIDT